MTRKSKIQLLSKSKLPKRLREIPNPPKQLWIDGNLPNMNESFKWLTVVGSRKNTIYGRDVCETLIKELAGYPIVIVSGLAIGIDSIALESALDSNLPCVAVPGSGLDESVLYPTKNINLARKISNSKNSCLLSEFDLDQKSELWTFPKRNRIMAGLSHSVLVIEAIKKSGTLITAKLATDYNRDIFAVPGNIFSGNSSGPHQLIQMGAKAITSGKDILEELGFDISEDNQASLFDESLLDNLSKEEKVIFNILNEPIHITKIQEKLENKIPQEIINQVLTELELKGLIKEVNKTYRQVICCTK